MSEYQLLGQNRPENFVGEGLRNSQVRAVDEGFSFVNKEWFRKCTSFDEGLDELERGRAESEDIKVSLDKVTATVDDNGVFCVEVNGNKYHPTEHALSQMSTKYGVGTWYPNQVAIVEKCKHANDGAVLASLFNHQREKLSARIAASSRMESEFILRTRKDGSLRAFMTAAYKPIDNRWFMELIRKYIPGGMLSHWRGDSDTIYGNVLIPDTIRTEDDSDYGGMVTIGNCEIGTRRILTQPGVFRHICWNGNIWDLEKGKSIRQVHRGKAIDLDSLAKQIAECIQEQIPLTTIHLDRLLATKGMATDVNIKPIIAQLAIDTKMSVPQATAVLKGYSDEVHANEVAKGTLFGVINAITRASQTFSAMEWYNMDMAAGDLTMFTDSKWDSLVRRASSLSVEQTDKQFAAVLAS